MTKRKYFGTNGVRGVVGELITNPFVNKLTSAISSFIENKGVVVVGSDARTSSPFIKHAVISTLLSSGVDVIDIGLVPTPLTQFAVRKLKARLGIMITASHNPPQFNGLKVISDDGIELSVEDQIKVEKKLEEGDFYSSDWTKLGDVTEINMIDEYIDQIISFVDVDKILKKKMKVVVDGGNGVGSLVTPYLFKELGMKVFSINTTLDGHFPGRGSEPSPQLLTEMAKTAKSVNADFSIAHDGDADRAIFGDERGVVYWGDRSIAIFEKMILQNEQNKLFVTPVSSSSVVTDIAEEIGGKVEWTKVGCIYVSRTMQKLNAILGGEENGGLFYSPHVPVRDGAMAGALMAHILSTSSSTLSELMNELPQYAQLKDKVECPNNLKSKVLDAISSRVKGYTELITIDGLKAIYDNEWMLIRPSGTEPIFRIFVEANTMDEAEKLLKEGKKTIRETIESFQ